MDAVTDFLTEWGPRVLGAVVILLVGRWLIALAVRGLDRAMDRRDVEETARRFLGSVMKAVLWAVVLIAVLGLFGVPTTSFVAILGALGLAIGLALQDSIANFAGGVIILVFKPFVAGEYVEAAGESGTVHLVEIVATTLLTPDNKQVIVPNGQIIAAPITNYSREAKRRVDLVFGIGYGDDLRAAKQLLERMAADDERVLDDPEPAFPVLALGDSAVDVGARLWVAVDDYWPVYFDWTERVKLAFDAEGISIPYPQADVHLVAPEVAPTDVAPSQAPSVEGPTGGDVEDEGS
jgi:small conductance mechanosensitive channel